MVIISPYAKPGYTDTSAASFASVLSYTEAAFDLPYLTTKDELAYDFSGSFDYSQAPLAPVHMTITPVSRAELQAVADSPPDPDDPT